MAWGTLKKLSSTPRTAKLDDAEGKERKINKKKALSQKIHTAFNKLMKKTTYPQLKAQVTAAWVWETGFLPRHCKHGLDVTEVVGVEQWWSPLSVLSTKWGEGGESLQKFCVRDLHPQMDCPLAGDMEGHTTLSENPPLGYWGFLMYWVQSVAWTPLGIRGGVPTILSNYISPKNTLVILMTCCRYKAGLF